MKLSNYNIIFKNKNNVEQYIAFNSSTSALALMSIEEYETLANSIKDNGETDLQDLKLMEELQKGKFLIENNVDELKKIQFEVNNGRFSKSSLGLTIAPTSDCNFACPYCYEKNSINCITMSDEVQNKLVEFVDSYLTNNKINHFSVSWYGGEPLLVPHIIKSLTNKFLELCENHRVSYSAGIVTNGYFLNKKNLKLLEECKVSSMQITLDGNKKSHDSRRCLIGGQGTFNVIVSNLSNLKDSNIVASLRVNIDKDNIDSAKDVINTIVNNGLKNKVYPYPAFVYNGHGGYEDSKCYSYNEYSEIEFDFYREMTKQGFAINFNRFIPQQIRSCCGADRMSGYVINADGLIYKCWEDMGQTDKCIGDIAKCIDFNSKRLIEYFTFDPTQIEQCSKCDILPICMGGGCPCRGLEFKESKCIKYRYNLKDYLQFSVNLQCASNK